MKLDERRAAKAELRAKIEALCRQIADCASVPARVVNGDYDSAVKWKNDREHANQQIVRVTDTLSLNELTARLNDIQAIYNRVCE